MPSDDLREVRSLYPRLEQVGHDRAFSFEAKHNPFVPLATAAEHTSRLELVTAVAIAFARTPMTLANVAWDLQVLTRGRFVLGLGSQIRPHIPSIPAARSEHSRCRPSNEARLAPGAGPPTSSWFA